MHKIVARPGTIKELWGELETALENAGYTVRHVSTRAGQPAIKIDGSALATPRTLSLKTFANARKKKSR
jgi:hypothetical protein